MPTTYCRTDLIGARMVLRSEQGSYDCDPLGGNGDPALTTPRDELAESLSGVPIMPPSIDQPDFPHEPLLGDERHCARPTTSASENADDG